jgi:hypothetical protein
MCCYGFGGKKQVAKKGDYELVMDPADIPQRHRID